ncbi:hypothetical protein ACTMTJ_20760 [Phytohabitans sp. LJ34]|uniref:hypothetical protein n=1 Tax=Phytohabitans sp. LJ34 TaxID=3452217 RepID=UPI003F893E2E
MEQPSIRPHRPDAVPYPPKGPERRPRRAFVAALAAMVVTAAGVLAFAGQAGADLVRPPVPSPSLSRPPVISTTLHFNPPPLTSAIAGDSYISGEGTGGNVYPTKPNGEQDWRHQSGYSQAHLAWLYLSAKRWPRAPYTVASNRVESAWGGDRLSFVASSGATTAHLTTSQIDPDTNLPRSGPQLDGIDPLSNLVFFGFGGNDARYAELFEAAIGWLIAAKLEQRLHPIPVPNIDRLVQTAAVARKAQQLLALMPQVKLNIENALTRTWQRAPNAQIVVMLYPLGLKPSGNPDIPFIFGSALDKMYPFGAALNNAIRQAVASFQQRYPSAPQPRIFDPNAGGLIAGHELGQPSSYFNGLHINLDELWKRHKLHATQESFHYNQFGTVAVGKALATWTAQQFPAMFPEGPNFTGVITDPHRYGPNDTLVKTDLDSWLDSHTDELCTIAQGAQTCNTAVADANGTLTYPGTVPPTGGATGTPGGYITDYMFGAYFGLAQANAGNPPPDNGPAFSYYMQDPSGKWLKMETNAQGEVEWTPMPPGWTPPPNSCTPGGSGGGPLGPLPTATPCPFTQGG